MAILVDGNTRVIVQGITGRSGTFYTEAALRYGSPYVGGVRPGKGGTMHLGLPVFDTVEQAVVETQADASMILAPAHNAAAAMIEAIEAGIGVIVCVTERVPIADMIRVKAALRGSASELVGANSHGVLTPGACKIGVMATQNAAPGKIGIASRSASLTSEIVAQTSAAGLGQSTTVGVGGDAIHGIGFRRCLELYKDDAATEAVILIGEIGGVEEEEAADYLASAPYGKPIVALVVGQHAPPERRMGHAGTLSISGAGSWDAKCRVLRDAGVAIAANADEVVSLLA